MLINLNNKRLGKNRATKKTAVALAMASITATTVSSFDQMQKNNGSNLIAHADEVKSQNTTDDLSPQVQADIKNQYGFDAVKAKMNNDKSLTLTDKNGVSLTITNPTITNEIKDVTAQTDNDDPSKYLDIDVENKLSSDETSTQGNGQTNQKGDTNKNVNLNLPNDLSSVRQKIVDLAKTQLGVPYVWGGNSWGKGMDCSGLVQQVYKQVGINLPRTSQEQSKLLKDVSLDEAKPGDLVYWGGKGTAYHIAIYVGNGKIIEEPNPSTPCHVVDLYGNYQIGTLEGVN